MCLVVLPCSQGSRLRVDGSLMGLRDDSPGLMPQWKRGEARMQPHVQVQVAEAEPHLAVNGMQVFCHILELALVSMWVKYAWLYNEQLHAGQQTWSVWCCKTP